MNRSLAAMALGMMACLLLTNPVPAQEISAEDVISGCAEAMGGVEGLAELKTLRFKTVDPRGRALPWEIERPNRVRKETDPTIMTAVEGMELNTDLGEDRFTLPPGIQ